MVGNTASKVGGAHLVYPSLKNCIVWGNRDDSGETLAAQVLYTNSASYSCIQGLKPPGAGLGNIGSDPLFVDADGLDNIYGTEDDNLRLLPGSPCIDAGSNSLFPANMLTDLAGLPRFFDDPATPDTGAGPAPIIDMGTYEFHPTAATDLDRDGNVDATDVAMFRACAGLPMVPAVADCGRFDFDGDADVDQEDFGLLQGCYGGPTTPVPPPCPAVR